MAADAASANTQLNPTVNKNPMIARRPFMFRSFNGWEPNFIFRLRIRRGRAAALTPCAAKRHRGPQAGQA
jgi:hypothetical protein